MAQLPNTIPAALDIRQVANGFVVAVDTPRHRDQVAPSLDRAYVFQTFAELVGYLDKHFSWRDGKVTVDLDTIESMRHS